MDRPDPPPRLASAADPRRFLLARGERIALLGRESGEFELWSWPVQLAHGIRLRVRERGEELTPAPRVAWVETGADRFRLRWVAPEVTLELEAAADPRARVLVLALRVDCARELEVALLLEPSLRPMWPAGLGARVATRDEATGALLLTEERGRFAALVGCPEAEPVDARGDHSLGAGPIALRVQVSPARAALGPIPIVVAAAEVRPRELDEGARRGADQAAVGLARTHEALAAARELYRGTLVHWDAPRRAQEAHFADLLARELRFDASEPRHAEAFLWARLAIERAWVDAEGLGRGLVAGIAPAGHGDRPGYAWFFDGDALIASRALTACGDREGTREVLRFAASHQRADGKLMHELVLSATLCDWTGDFPYAYYKGENAARFVACLAHHVRWSGDLDLARELWPTVERGLAWCVEQLDEEGRLSNTKAGIAAVEAGPLSGRIAAEIFLHGMFVGATAGAAWLARLLGREADAERYGALEERSREALETFWSSTHERYAFAHLVDGGRADELSAYTALPIAAGHGRPERASATARQLNHPTLCADWGARMFPEGSATYDPQHYNQGSVFPYLTNFVTLALYRQALPGAAYQVLASQVALHGFSGLGCVPEHLVGDRAVEPSRGVPLQIFSSAAIVQSTLFGLCGLEPDAPRGCLTLAPSLPADWDGFTLERLAVGETLLDLRLARERRGGASTLRLWARRRSGPALRLRFAPRLAPLSQLVDARAGERALDAHLEAFETGVRVVHTAELALEEELTIELELRVGPEPILPRPVLEEGLRSRALRLVDQGAGATSCWYEFWGRPGTRHRLRFASDLCLASEPALGADGALELRLPASDAPYVAARVTLSLEDPE